MVCTRITVRKLSDQQLSIQVPEASHLCDSIRRIEGSRWSSVLQRWSVPNSPSAVRAIREAFDGHEYQMDSDIAACVSSDIPAAVSFPDDLRSELEGRKYSGQTIKSYLYFVNDLCVHSGKNAHALTGEDVAQYLTVLEVSRSSTASTRNIALSAIKFYFEQVRKVPLDVRAIRPKREKKLPSVLTREEVQRLILAPDNLKHRAILVLAYSGGLRVSEIARLRASDIDFVRKVIRVRTGKGGDERFTLLSDSAIRILDEYIRDYGPREWLFEGQKENLPVTVRTIQKVFEFTCEKACLPRPLSIHSLRHSFATHLLEDGIDIRYIQRLMGHESSRTTEIYHHVVQQQPLKATLLPDAASRTWLPVI